MTPDIEKRGPLPTRTAPKNEVRPDFTTSHEADPDNYSWVDQIVEDDTLANLNPADPQTYVCMPFGGCVGACGGADGHCRQDALLSEHRRRELNARLGARTLADIDPTPPPPLLIDRLHPTEHTILFGDGGVGKGTIVAHWIRNLTNLGMKVLVLDYENHPTEWASRIFGLGGDRSMVFYLAPLTEAWHGQPGPIWNQIDDIGAFIADNGIDYVVVDSIVAACIGHDVSKPETASLYSGFTQRLGLGILSIAHVTKQGNPHHPFGSAFWHNFARVTWSAQHRGNGVILKNRKANQHRRGAAFIVEAHYADNGQLLEVEEKGYQQKILDLVVDVLEAANTPLSLADIVAKINDETEDEDEKVDKDTVRKTIRRDLGRKHQRRLDVEDGLYRLHNERARPRASLVALPSPIQQPLIGEGVS
jgi:hypothetical protein